MPSLRVLAAFAFVPIVPACMISQPLDAGSDVRTTHDAFDAGPDDVRMVAIDTGNPEAPDARLRLDPDYSSVQEQDGGIEQLEIAGTVPGVTTDRPRYRVQIDFWSAAVAGIALGTPIAFHGRITNADSRSVVFTAATDNNSAVVRVDRSVSCLCLPYDDQVDISGTVTFSVHAGTRAAGILVVDETDHSFSGDANMSLDVSYDVLFDTTQ